MGYKVINLLAVSPPSLQVTIGVQGVCFQGAWCTIITTATISLISTTEITIIMAYITT